MNQDAIHIVCCSDANYLRHTATMLVSLFENNKWATVTIHLLGTNICDSELNKFKTDIERFGHTLCYYAFDETTINSLPSGTHSYISKTTYCRLFIQDILPQNIEKVLYLDGDILVVSDIKELWDTDLSNNLVGAVSDEVNGYKQYYQRFGFPKEHIYFNAGVLMINLTEWRKEDVKQKALEFISQPNRPQLDNADQDILNVVCCGKIKELPLRFNLQDALLRRSVPNIREEVVKVIDKEIENACLFHFSCVKKPWQFKSIHPVKSVYKKYQEKTSWKGLQDKISMNDLIYMGAYWVAYALGMTNKYRKSISIFAKSIKVD